MTSDALSVGSGLPVRTSSRIAFNQVVGWAASLTQVVVGLLMVPFLIGSLGQEGFGLISLLAVLVSMSALADFGLRTALERHLAEQVANGRHQRFKELLSSALILMAGAGLLAGLGVVVLAPWLAEWFGLSPAVARDGVALIRCYGGLAIPLSFVIPVYAAVLTAHGRFDLLSGLYGLTTVVQALALVIVLGLTTLGLYGWLVVSLGDHLLRLLLLRHVGLRQAPNARTSARLFKRDAVGELFSLGWSVSAPQLAKALGAHANSFVLATVLGPAAVAVYRAGTVLPSRIQPLMSLADQLHPFATAYHASGQATRLRETLIRGTRYTLLLGILPCVVLGVFAEPIARFWLARSLGPDYRVAAQVMAGWSVVELIAYSGGAQWPVLLAMKRLRFLVWASLPMAVLNVAVSICLVVWTSLGVNGVVVATIVIGMIWRPILIVYTARACGLDPMAYVRQAYLGPVGVVAALGSWAWLLLGLGVADSLPGLVAVVLATGLVWLALVWYVGSTQEDRDSFRQLAKRLTATIGSRSSPAVVPDTGRH